MQLDIIGLQTLVKDWFSNQQPLPTSLVININMTNGNISFETSLKRFELLSEVFTRENFQVVGQTEQASRTINAIKFEIKHGRNELSWESSTVDDFKKIIPTDVEFLRLQHTGPKTLKAFNLVLNYTGHQKL